MFLKLLIGMTLFTEAAGLLIPLLISPASAWLEDHVTDRPNTGGFLRFLSRLNIEPTRPASLIWLSIKYHFQPSLLTGGPGPMLRAVAAYLLHAVLFFVIGSYMFKQALELWFQESYRTGLPLACCLARSSSGIRFTCSGAACLC
jgi:hypothetical protein